MKGVTFLYLDILASEPLPNMKMCTPVVNQLSQVVGKPNILSTQVATPQRDVVS